MKTYRAFLLLLPVFVLNACASKSEFVVVADDVKKLKTETETVRSQSAAHIRMYSRFVMRSLS